MLETFASWFGPKRIGYGWRPITWQGWLVTATPAIVVFLTILITRKG